MQPWDAFPVEHGAAITHDEVGQAVHAQLGPQAMVETWAVHTLGRGRGDATTSLGTSRVSGTARVGTARVPWSQIRKVYVPPDAVAGVDMGRSPGHWNYWFREPKLLASGHLARLPDGVVAPVLYLLTDGEERATVWMEDLGTSAGVRWTKDGLGRVAHGLGRLAGAFVGHPPEETWLSTDLLGQWVRDLPAWTLPLRGDGLAGWNHAVARSVFARGSASPVAALLDQAAGQLDVLAVGQRTLCHRDTGLDNLVLRPDAVALFDWALTGTGAVGEDLGVLFASATREVPAEPIALCRSMLHHYIAGLGLVAKEIGSEAIWRTAVVTAALRESIFAAFHISRAIEGTAPDGTMLTALARDAAVVEAFAREALASDRTV